MFHTSTGSSTSTTLFPPSARTPRESRSPPTRPLIRPARSTSGSTVDWSCGPRKDDFNAIDPNLVIDQNGEAWLAFGSFWTGIKMRHLDRHTGLLSSKDTQLYSLASRAVVHPGPRDLGLPPDAEAIEAPFVFQHQGFFYLFVSWDLCCRGLKSTYRTMVGRSRAVTGPFVDRDGKLLTDGGGTPLLRANSTWLGPGGASLVHLPAADLIAFHAYSAIDGRPALQLSTINWKDGWPAAALEGDKP